MPSYLEFRNHQREQYDFRWRLLVASLLVLCCFGILASRFYYLQVMRYEHYQTLADNNRISIVPTVPNRGLIFDRNGVVLAHNYFVYTLEITPGKVDDLEQTIADISELVPVSKLDRKRFNKLRAENHNFIRVPLRSHLTETEAAKFAVHRYRFPGVEIRARLFRHYPQGTLGAHLIGYIGRINDKDIKNLTEAGDLSNYKGSDHIGKGGIEQYYERELHGVTGSQQVEIDADGHAVRVLSSVAPVAGENLILSIDSTMQKIGEEAFAGRRGALVAIDPKTGEILSYVSQPSFDPNLFVDGIDSENWKALNESLDRPLVNRPLHGVYPPGSTLKPFVALAGLEAGRREPPFSISDAGYFSLPGKTHRYRDWKPAGHGQVDMRRAITVSCDTFFYGLAHEMGIDRLADFLQHFGFGQKTGIDIQGENGGLLPTPAWKWKRWKQPWYPGETVITGIGQGYTLVTPLQLAHATAIFANNGVSMRPHLVTSIQNNRTGISRPVKPQVMDQIALAPKHIDLVREAMVDVTRPGGTAVIVGAGSPYSIAAKTGTAQVIGIKQNEKYDEKNIAERHRDHALFIAYAPAEDPKIAVAVIVENGSHGGSTAGPIARKVMDYYLLGKLPDAQPAAAAAVPPPETIEEEHSEAHD